MVTRNVWVTQNPNLPFDFGPARKYGTVRFLTEDDITGHISDAEVVADVRSALIRNWVQADDWFVFAGSPYVAAMVFMVATELAIRTLGAVPPLRILEWDNRNKLYRPITVDLRRNDSWPMNLEPKTKD